MGKRRNQPLIDSDSASNNESGSDLESVNCSENYMFKYSVKKLIDF